MLDDVTTLIFDLDGTISDPSVGISRSINYALAEYGFPEVSAAQVAPQIGPPLDETFRKFQPQADQETIAGLIAKYRERYAEVGYAENEIYAGMAAEIEALTARGFRLGVCTSKRRDFAVQILRLFGLQDCFAFVSGGEIGVGKSRQLSDLLGDGEIGRDAVMIGDREVDVHAAHANGLRSLGVLWGFGSLAELSAAGPTGLLREVGELRGLCAG